MSDTPQEEGKSCEAGHNEEFLILQFLFLITIIKALHINSFHKSADALILNFLCSPPTCTYKSKVCQVSIETPTIQVASCQADLLPLLTMYATVSYEIQTNKLSPVPTHFNDKVSCLYPFSTYNCSPLNDL